MRELIYLRGVTVLTLVFLILGTSRTAGYHRPGQAAEASTAGSSYISDRWLIETIESTPMVYVGQHVSVAIAPYTGAISISHYDATNHDLRHAKSVGSGGNCGEHNDWNCWLRDGGSVTDVGQYSSLALEPIIHADTYDWAKFAYYHASQGALKYTARDWPGTWHYTIIDDPEPIGAIAGTYASLALDSSKIPHIAYHSETEQSGSGSLKYATYVGGGGGNCGDGDWQCDAVHSGAISMGRYASLDLSGGDTPSIAYYDGSFHDLLWARKGGTYTNCGPGGNTWACFIIDYSGDVGMFASLVWDKSSGIPQIAYYDATNEALKYAVLVGSGGNCGYFGGEHLWQCDEIDEMGPNISDDHQRISMALDPDGHPIIAYQQTSEFDPAVLKVARPAAALGLDHGNCGPEDLFLTWQCDTVDNGSSWTSVADYVDIALSSAGLATIAYYESDSYHQSGNLKVARQVLVIYLPLVVRNAP